MKIFNTENEKSLPYGFKYKYSNIAFDGCNYFFTIYKKCEILIYDLDFKSKGNIKTIRSYNYICYDTKEECFWATSICCPNKIFKLDKKFQEIDFSPINEKCNLKITGLSYNCSDDSLLISTARCILKYIKKSECIEVIKKLPRYYITGILSLSPTIVVTVFIDKNQYLLIYDKCGKLIKKLCVPNLLLIKNLIFNPCMKFERDIVLVGLGVKRCCYPYIFKITLSLCDIKLCNCNYVICDEYCDKKDDDCKDAATNIVNSIALIETALGHILNSEGEKLQKVISSTDDIDKILCVNKEVSNTIVNITHLENILYDKLNILNEKFDCCLGDDCKKKC